MKARVSGILLHCSDYFGATAFGYLPAPTLGEAVERIRRQLLDGGAFVMLVRHSDGGGGACRCQ